MSSYHKITAAFVDAGYTEKELAAMWSGNALRLLRAAEDHATTVAAEFPAGASRLRQ